jgi:hypothetical protein
MALRKVRDLERMKLVHLKPSRYVKNNTKAALGANGGLVNMTTPIHKGVGKIQGTSHVKFVKGGITCDEGAKIVASSLNQDKFQALKTQELSSQMYFYTDYKLTRKHRGKVVAMFVVHHSWNTKVKSYVWVSKVLVTNTQEPKYFWVPKRKE